MFINVTTRQQISIYSIAPTDICLLVPPHLEKWGYKNFFPLAPLANPVFYPHLKIRGAAHACKPMLLRVFGVKLVAQAPGLERQIEVCMDDGG